MKYMQSTKSGQVFEIRGQEGDFLELVPYGGGIVVKVSVAEISKHFVSISEVPTARIQSSFQIDDGPIFVGIHNPAARWNGWATPLFTLAETRKIIAHVTQGQDPESPQSYHVDLDAGVMIWKENLEEGETAESVALAGGARLDEVNEIELVNYATVRGVSFSGWCWSEVKAA